MRKMKKKSIAILITAVLVAGGAGAAYAYWAAGGGGTGAGSTGTNVALSVVQTSSVTNLRPGAAPQTLTGNFTNTNDSPTYVGTVTATISGVSKALGAPTSPCGPTDYTLGNAAMTVNAQVPSGTAQGAWTGATIAFNNIAGTNQDGCKGATVTLTYAIS